MGPGCRVLQNYRIHPSKAVRGPFAHLCSHKLRIIRRLLRRNHQFRLRVGDPDSTEVLIMLSWVVTFLVIALIAGILGFGGVAGASIEIAKVIFFIAVVLFLVSAVISVARGRTRV